MKANEFPWNPFLRLPLVKVGYDQREYDMPDSLQNNYGYKWRKFLTKLWVILLICYLLIHPGMYLEML